jgi:transcriptional regulator with XRE-family HTH domain
MVDITEFAKRLNILMDYYELPAALLADKIDVQRSSISHILSGRNKPSLDFVLKILKAFPEVELFWLLNGVGKFPNEVEKKEVAPTLFKNEIAIDKKEPAKDSAIIPDVTPNEIERIVIFFKDGTFKNYKP